MSWRPSGLLATSAVLIWLAAFIGVISAPAQVSRRPRIVKIEDAAPRCRRCSLALDTVAVLGRDEGRIARYPIQVTRDGRGRYYVTVRPPGDLVLAYDSAGRFLRRIGQRGRALGQFDFPIWVAAGTGDSLRIFDFTTATETVLDPSWRAVRRDVGVSPTLLWRGNGSRVVTSADPGDPSASTSAVQILGNNGRVVATFNRAPPGDTTSGRAVPRVAASADGGVWTMDPLTYTARKWSAAGELEFELRRSAPWLQHSLPISDGVFGFEPSPRIWDIREDRQHRLWVLAGVAAQNWKEALGEPNQSGSGWAYQNIDRGRLFDSIIEVLDPDTGGLIVSFRVRAHARFLLDDRRIVVYREGPDRRRLIEVLQVTINNL